MDSDKTAKLSFEAALIKLEAIVDSMEQGEVALADLLARDGQPGSDLAWAMREAAQVVPLRHSSYHRHRSASPHQVPPPMTLSSSIPPRPPSSSTLILEGWTLLHRPATLDSTEFEQALSEQFEARTSLHVGSSTVLFDLYGVHLERRQVASQIELHLVEFFETAPEMDEQQIALVTEQGKQSTLASLCGRLESG